MGSPITSVDICAVVPGATGTVCEKLEGLFRLAELLCTYFEWKYDTQGNPTEAYLANLAALSVPTGTVIWRPVATVPDGYLEANGQAVSRTTYAGLYAVYGTAYGAGDLVNTFNLPDMQDRFAIGASGSKPVGGDGGAETVTISASQLPAHTHGLTTKLRTDISNGSSSGVLGNQGISQGTNVTLTSDANTPNAQPLNILPSYMAGKWLVKH